jgi:twitching motility two-component system response regulator PilG
MKLEFESNTSTPPYINDGGGGVSRNGATAKISQTLEAGIKAAQEGNRAEARQLLLQVAEAEPDNENAWLWMASISEYPEELIIFLTNVLNVNPNNARALEWMKATKSLLAQTFVQRGVDASNESRTDFARQCFLQAIVHDAKSETAWFWLASISDSAEEKISHLQKVLSLNPENETAGENLRAARNQVAESILQKANRAAISGEREVAREMLQEVFKHSPELEEAWMLKSYLADSFSEKVTCFERVLSLNLENEMAIAGLASLRAMMAKSEAKKAEQAALIAASVENDRTEAVLIVTEDQFVFEEIDEEENQPTQKLEFPPDFAPPVYYVEGEENSQTDGTNEIVSGFLTVAAARQHYDDFYRDQEQISPQPDTDESFADDGDLAENDSTIGDAGGEPVQAPDEAADNDYTSDFEQPETNYFEQNDLPEGEILCAPVEELSALVVEDFTAENPVRLSVEMAACPFCSAENESNAFVCGSCRTILTLSDLEMILAHTEADRELLRPAVERMETEKNFRQFSAGELKNLAIGQINLKNLRLGVMYLQKAAQTTPNDVMLASQVNSLKIRLAEIEQQESAQSSMAKGRKILIVDDSATVRKLISSKLEKSGHEVMCAADGIDALEKIKGFVPDLILLDIMMPQLDGYQVCKLIRANDATRDVPIVMISGKDGFFDKVRGRMAGTTGYITKPFGPETLMRTVETYILPKGEMMTESESADEEVSALGSELPQ